MRSPATATPARIFAGLLTVGAAQADELWVTNQTANQVHVLDAGTLEARATIPTGANPNAVGFDKDFTRAFISNLADGTVTVVDAVARKVIATLRSGDGAHSVNLTPDGGRVFVANSGEATVSVFDTASLALTMKLKH